MRAHFLICSQGKLCGRNVCTYSSTSQRNQYCKQHLRVHILYPHVTRAHSSPQRVLITRQYGLSLALSLCFSSCTLWLFARASIKICVRHDESAPRLTHRSHRTPFSMDACIYTFKWNTTHKYYYYILYTIHKYIVYMNSAHMRIVNTQQSAHQNAHASRSQRERTTQYILMHKQKHTQQCAQEHMLFAAR